MEFLFGHSTHFIILGATVMFISGIGVYFIPNLHYLIPMLFCGLSGFIYEYYFYIPDLAPFAAFYTMILSIVGAGIAKLLLFLINLFKLEVHKSNENVKG